MSYKKRNRDQNTLPPSTKETLGLVIKRAGELSRYLSENYSDGDIRKFSISRNTDIEGDKWKAHSLIFGSVVVAVIGLIDHEGLAARVGLLRKKGEG